jgi:hypothetical protein
MRKSKLDVGPYPVVTNQDLEWLWGDIQVDVRVPPDDWSAAYWAARRGKPDWWFWTKDDLERVHEPKRHVAEVYHLTTDGLLSDVVSFPDHFQRVARIRGTDLDSMLRAAEHDLTKRESECLIELCERPSRPTAVDDIVVVSRDQVEVFVLGRRGWCRYEDLELKEALAKGYSASLDDPGSVGDYLAKTRAEDLGRDRDR